MYEAVGLTTNEYRIIVDFYTFTPYQIIVHHEMLQQQYFKLIMQNGNLKLVDRKSHNSQISHCVSFVSF